MLYWSVTSFAQSSIGTSDPLAAALTTEGLLFAAFSVSFGLTQPVEGGRHPFFSQGWLGWCIVVVITIVAAAAGGAWWETFGAVWPHTCSGRVLAVGLAAGIVAQPVLAAVLASQAKRG